MDSMTSVLVAVDGSENSMRAVQTMVKQIKSGAAMEVHLLNVQPELPAIVSRPLSKKFIDTYHDEEGDKALSGAISFLDQAGIPFTPHIRIGQVAETIAAFAKEMQCEQIIMGVRGVGGIFGLLLGSVANKVLYLVDVPVTLVK